MSDMTFWHTGLLQTDAPTLTVKITLTWASPAYAGLAFHGQTVIKTTHIVGNMNYLWLSIDTRAKSGSAGNVKYLGTAPAGDANIAVLVDADDVVDWLQASLHVDVRAALLKAAHEIRFL